MDLRDISFLLLGLTAGQVLLFFLFRGRLQRLFGLLAGEALLQNNQNFVELAKTTLEKFQAQAEGDLALKQRAIQDLVSPLKTALERQEKQAGELEQKREQAYGGLRQYLENVAETQNHLRKETGNLVKALRSSSVRGKWGEMNLRRVVEMAGLVEHCDFVSQPSTPGSESRLRPDLIVHLPDQRRLVIDAKTPLDSYLQAVEAEDEGKRAQLLAEHSRQLERHVNLLASKEYWDQVEGSPDFVLLYVPLESLFSAALQNNPGLLEKSIQKKVLLATPTTLIAVLKSVEYSWKQVQLAQNAREISALGKELYDRLSTLAVHFGKLGSSLDRAVEAYNQTAGSLERRVFVQARRFKDLGVPAKNDVPEIFWIDSTTRRLQQEELLAGGVDEEVDEIVERARVS